MSTLTKISKTSKVLRVLGQPDRLLILMAIGGGEACVCHLKAVLKKRQAFISQHLMAMREAWILETRRDGRYIFYRVKNQHTFDLIRLASSLAGLQEGDLLPVKEGELVVGCECPKCSREENPQTINVEEISLS